MGDVLGQANCIQRLGNIALARSDHAAARALYEQAQPLYEQVGDVLGQANCIKSLGDIERTNRRPAEARERYLHALTMYEQIQEPYSMGVTCYRLAGLSDAEPERKAWLNRARECWQSIDRPDLVQRFLDGGN